MWLLGDLADWWDARRREANVTLDDWVRDASRGSDAELYAVVLAATLTHTAMEVGGGFVDVLRLGRGVARGTIGGFAQDGLRLLTVLPAVRPALRLSSRVITRLVGFTADVAPATGTCSVVSAAHALRQTAVRHFVTVAQILRALNMTLEQAAAGVWLRQLFPALRELGANPAIFRGIHSAEALVEMLRQVRTRGVALFSVFWELENSTVGHTMVAFLEGGQLRILDRTGRIFRSLQEMEQVYGNIGSVPNRLQWTRPFIGPPARGVGGWGEEVLFIPEAVPLPGLPPPLADALSYGGILGHIGFEVRAVMLMSRDEADRTWRQRRGAGSSAGSPPELRDGVSRF